MTKSNPSVTSPEWRDLPTEARHASSHDLDTLATSDIVSLLLTEDRAGLDSAHRHHATVASVADRFAQTLESGGDVVFAGAGTSGRLGIIEAAECPPTFGTDPQRIRAIIAGGPEAVFRAQEGSEDREDDGRRDVGDLEPGDLLIGLSASSVTPYVNAALGEARRRGAGTALITCATESSSETPADLILALGTGPEILTGSTRLKAGSATKAVLNAITTAAMVRLGKVFENLMVDLKPGSAKLRDRAVRIVESIGGVARSQAEHFYRSAGGEVKTAIVMARRGISATAARDRLAATDGHLRPALSDDKF